MTKDKTTQNESPGIEVGSATTYEPNVDQIHEIIRRFTYHPPDYAQLAAYREIRDLARHQALRMLALCPASRELSLAHTHLEQAVMYANAAIARRTPEVRKSPFGSPAEETVRAAVKRTLDEVARTQKQRSQTIAGNGGGPDGGSKREEGEGS